MASAAGDLLNSADEAKELRPRLESSYPIERVKAENLLEVPFDFVPAFLYESEDSSDFPGASSALGPKKCRLKSASNARHSATGRFSYRALTAS